MAVNVQDLISRIVYGVFLNNNLIYIGSTHLPMNILEYNHRNWKEKNYSETKFRKNLTDNEKYINAEFRELAQYDKCTLRQIETLEGKLIRAFKPEFNVDMDPVASSIAYGRY